MASPSEEARAARAAVFGQVADAYERGRPEYPAAAVRWLVRHLELSADSVVLDLAAGTGKLTRSVRTVLPARLIAVEPAEGMRRAFARQVPDIPILPGSAERIPLGDRVVDAVVVGQAFHWFRGAEALEEIARVLRPRGGLALLYNHRDTRVPWVARFGALLHEVDPESDPVRNDRSFWGLFEGSREFDPLEVERFESRPATAPQAIVDLALSRSYVARLPAEVQAGFAEKVRAFVASDPDLTDRKSVPFPYLTEVHCTRRRGSPASGARSARSDVADLAPSTSRALRGRAQTAPIVRRRGRRPDLP